jgi:hypothetical protein
MAIQVGGTTVVDNSRNLTNIAAATLSGTLTTVKIAETAVALGTVTTTGAINLANGTLFTATLGGNCTFTISNPTGVSTFTLVLTNDATPGRTVAWSGGTFKYPGGAASLSRTTTAAGIDIWVFFSPDGGTNWYGNIAQKAHAA